jgi:methylated-DNA-[protein]-cysteine S-methyltransferase
MGTILEPASRVEAVRAHRTEYGVRGWGVGTLWTRNDGVVLAHEFAFGNRNGPRGTDGSGLVARLRAFFAGEDVRFDDVRLDLRSTTPFQRAVADALRAVPRGEIVSYGELAALAGHPNAQRAVGTFCACNRLMLFVPCHRVVAADGIGGYGSAGVAVKRRLLALEGVEL